MSNESLDNVESEVCVWETYDGTAFDQWVAVEKQVSVSQVQETHHEAPKAIQGG